MGGQRRIPFLHFEVSTAPLIFLLIFGTLGERGVQKVILRIELFFVYVYFRKFMFMILADTSKQTASYWV